MFRIEVFVNDNKLGEALRALAGVALGDPKVQPVVNGAMKNGKVTAATSGNVSDLFVKYAKAHRLKTFGANEVRAFAKSIGRAESSYGYLLGNLVKYHVVKKTGKGTSSRYNLVTK